MHISNLWLDPQLPYELEEVFLTYGTPSFAMHGETILKMDECKDHFYYVADGLLAVLAKTSATSGVFLSKIIPDSRAFGFTFFPIGWLEMFELKTLRDTVVYSLSYITMNNILQNGAADLRVFKRYQRIVKRSENLAASALISMNSSDRIISSVKSFNLADVKYNSFGLEKSLKLNENDIKELLLTTANYQDVYSDKPLHDKVTSTWKAIYSYMDTQKLTYS